MTTVQSQPLHLLVKRSAWEPKHEWESRLLFVEDNLDRFGLERAIHLSLVWANVNFLGCSYPAHTQELVSEYPLPDQELLRAEREKRERSQRKRVVSGGGGGRDREREPESKRVRNDQSTSSDTTTHNSSADEADLPFEDISQHLEALISTIRKQHEKKSEVQRGNETGRIPQEVMKMLCAMCMCSQCFCVGTSHSSQVNSIIQRYVARFDKTFKYDFSFTESKGITECRFLINGQFITEGRDENKKIAKQRAAERFVQLVGGYYREHGKPCCPQEPSRRNK